MPKKYGISIKILKKDYIKRMFLWWHDKVSSQRWILNSWTLNNQTISLAHDKIDTNIIQWKVFFINNLILIIIDNVIITISLMILKRWICWKIYIIEI